ncbi:MAG: tail fiber domain-containing protein [archaeon]|nr:tail fiber domain-containing protein [archaeon]
MAYVPITTRTSTDTAIPYEDTNQLQDNFDAILAGNVSGGKLAFDTTTLVVDATNNRVGIGTTTPEAFLEIASGITNIAANFNSTDEDVWISFSDDSTGGKNIVGIGAQGTSLMFVTNGAGQSYLNSSGYLGVNVEPIVRCQVNEENAESVFAISRGGSDIGTGTSIGSLQFLQDDSGSPDEWASIDVGSNDALSRTSFDFYVKSTGGSLRSGIEVKGTSAGVEVYMADVYSDDLNGTTYRDLLIKDDGQLGYDSSTNRKKTEISDQIDVSFLYDLNSVEFEYKKKDSDNNYIEEGTGVKEFGLIAEEVEAIDKRFVFYNHADEIVDEDYELEDGEWFIYKNEKIVTNDDNIEKKVQKYKRKNVEVEGVHYKKFIPVLIKEIQNLNNRIKILEK